MYYTFFKRNIDIELQKWTKETKHKPLLLRGAREIGKSSAIKNLEKSFKYDIEVNFEDKKELGQFSTYFIRINIFYYICCI